MTTASTINDLPQPNSLGQIALTGDWEIAANINMPQDVTLILQDANVKGFAPSSCGLFSGGTSTTIAASQPTGLLQPFITLAGDSHIQNLTIDGANSDQAIIDTSQQTLANSTTWKGVTFQNGGLLIAQNGGPAFGGVGFSCSSIGRFLAFDCKFINTGTLNFPSNSFLPSIGPLEIGSFDIDSCYIGFSISQPNQFFISHGDNAIVNTRFRVSNCTGSVDAIGGGLFSIYTKDAGTDKFQIMGNDIRLVNGLAFNSDAQTLLPGNPGLLFEGNNVA